MSSEILLIKIMMRGIEMNSTLPNVSVILPILNEERNLHNCVSAIINQDYPGEIEIILALGPSHDKTNELAEVLAKSDRRIKLIKNPSGQTANGLNLAIAAAQYEIICRIDGHSEIAENYLSTAIEIMKSTNADNVGGVMYAEGNTGLQRVIASAMRSKLGVGPAKFHTGGKAGKSDTVYLGTFKKSSVKAVGGFDERFIRAQDWELNHRIIKNGGLVWFDPRLKVIYRPRNSIIKLAKQYFQYGRWRRVVSSNYPETVNYRYLAPPFTVLAFSISLICSILINKFLLIPALIYCLLILLGGLVIGKSLVEKLLMPIVLFVMHFSWGIGFLTSSKRLLKSN